MKQDDKDKDEFDIDLDAIFGKDNFSLLPFEDDDKLETTKEHCLHPKKKKVKFQTFEYYFCPDCKREVKE